MFNLDPFFSLLEIDIKLQGHCVIPLKYYITITDILSSHFVMRNEFKETKVGNVMSL